jgi:O-antigen/teichoic acid export membrane protein
MSSNKSKFLKGVTSGYAYMIVSMIVSLWMVPFVLQYLTKPEYGIFAIAGDLLGWLGVANLGITAAFNSKGAQLIGAKNFKELNIIFSTTFFTQLATSLLIISGGLLISLNPKAIFGNIAGTENIELVVIILFAGFFIQYIMQPLNSLLIADKQIHIDNFLKFGLLIIQTTITIVLLVSGFKLLSLAISSFTSNIIISFITWFRIKRSFPELNFRFRYWEKERMKFLLTNGIWFTIGGIAGILIFRMDAFLIGKYLSLSLVASFLINNRLYQIAEKFHGQFFNITRPYFAQMYGKGLVDKMAQLYNFVYYSSFFSAFIIGIGIYFLGEWFIDWWVGPDFYLGRTINLLLSVNFIIQAGVLPNRIILASSLYKNKQHALTRIFDGSLKFIFSILFIQDYGILAILVASICASLVFSNISLNYLTGELLNEDFLIKLVPLIPIILIFCILLTSNLYYQILIFLISFLVFAFVTLKPIIEQNNFIKEFYAGIRKEN